MNAVEKAYWSMLAANEHLSHLELAHWNGRAGLDEVQKQRIRLHHSAHWFAQLSTVSPTQKVRPV